MRLLRFSGCLLQCPGCLYSGVLTVFAQVLDLCLLLRCCFSMMVLSGRLPEAPGVDRGVPPNCPWNGPRNLVVSLRRIPSSLDRPPAKITTRPSPEPPENPENPENPPNPPETRMCFHRHFGYGGYNPMYKSLICFICQSHNIHYQSNHGCIHWFTLGFPMDWNCSLMGSM